MLPAISCLHPKKRLKNRYRFFNRLLLDSRAQSCRVLWLEARGHSTASKLPGSSALAGRLRSERGPDRHRGRCGRLTRRFAESGGRSPTGEHVPFPVRPNPGDDRKTDRKNAPEKMGRPLDDERSETVDRLLANRSIQD